MDMGVIMLRMALTIVKMNKPNPPLTTKARTSSLVAHLARINEQVQVVRTEQVILKEIVDNTCKIFNDYDDFEAWATPSNISTLKPGTNIYFIARDIADLWFTGYSFEPLEGEKPDLSPFAKTAELPGVIHNEIGKEKGVANGIAYLDADGELVNTQTGQLEKRANKGIANGYCPLDKNSYVPKGVIEQKGVMVRVERSGPMASEGHSPVRVEGVPHLVPRSMVARA